jgi:Dolichyl-phosphate-mannose-protein mannosyltransferase
MRAAPAVAALVLTAVGLVFRLPPLFNTGAVNSDVAIAGLQAWRLARGEVALALWGTSYQGITGPVMALLTEAVIGQAPGVALRWSSMVGYSLLVLALFGVLRRSLGTRGAFALSLPLAVVPEAVNYLSYDACRVWSLTLVFAALFFAERALEALQPRIAARLAFVAGLALGLALYSDLIVVQLLPGLGVYGIAAAWQNRGRWRVLANALLGFALGALPCIPAKFHLDGGTSLANVSRNLTLMMDQCLPYLFGYSAFAWDELGHKNAVDITWAGHGLAVLGMGCFGALVAWGFSRSLSRATPAPLRRLAWLAGVWSAASVAGFLVSPRPEDVWAARYLGPLLLGFPFAAAAVWARLKARPAVALALVIPVVASFGAAGWRSYGAWVDGLKPVATPYGTGRDERELAQALLAKGVGLGVADYWVAYRLTYLSGERLIVSPKTEKRYPPYDAQVAAASRVAQIFFGTPAELETHKQDFADPARFELAVVGAYLAVLPVVTVP